ncbi:MAG: GNAT family N-acetyltransferase [Anaerolineae bacterium]|nr:GNAT family N-acetyltransferase [Anaerolineae bacterium]
MPAECRVIDYSDQYPLRATVLGQAASPKPGDDAPDTLHVGVYIDGQLVSIASVYHEPPPDSTDAGAWRLRGMATLPDAQGKGYGRLALSRCIDHVRASAGTRIWCNARAGAVDFYRALGFSVRADAQDVPGHGLRYYCERPV